MQVRSTGSTFFVYRINSTTYNLMLNKLLTWRHQHGPFSTRSEYRGQCCKQQTYMLATNSRHNID